MISGCYALVLDAIHDDQTLRHPHLRCSQTDAGRVVHRLQQVGSESAPFVRQIGHGGGDLLQTRVGVDQNRTFHRLPR